MFRCSSLLFFLITLNSGLLFSQQWRFAAGTEGFAVADIDIYFSDPDTMYALGSFTSGDTSLHSGLLISSDKGDSWQIVKNSPGTDVGAIKVDPFDSKRVYVSVYGFDGESNDIWMTKDGGQTWTRLFGGRSYPAPVVEIDPADPQTVYVGQGPGYIRRSTDRGETWGSITNPAAPFPPFLNALAIAASNDSILYAAYVKGLFKSTDKGGSWTRLSLDPGPNSISAVAIDAHNPEVVYAGIFSRGLPPGGVFKSTDGGATWETKNNGLDTTSWDVLTILVNPEDRREVFLGLITGYTASDTVGLVRSNNSGDTWSAFDSGIFGGIRSLAFNNLQHRLYAGGIGIYANDSIYTFLSGKHAASPLIFSLHQNYPNPFNASTILQYELSEKAFVNLSVYDVLGRKVRTLVRKVENPGTHGVRLDGSDLAGGVYFYRLTSGAQVLVRKAVLAK